MRRGGFIPALGAIALAMGGCVSDRCTGMSAPTPKEEPPGPAAAAPKEKTAERGAPSAPGGSKMNMELALVFIPEMGPYPAEFGGSARGLSASEQAAFVQAWREAGPDVVAGVTAAKLVEISRWAVQQTASATLERGWAAAMPMQPMGASADGQRVLMGQTAEESKVPLPSHNAVVFRRLLVAAEFDRGSGRVGRVFVTIRGWAEE